MRSISKLPFTMIITLVLLAIAQPNAVAEQDGGYSITADLWAKAVLKPSSGDVTLMWKQVGADTTPSGDRVVSGYFYADADEFAYGSEYNPEVFVKVYIATNGWVNIAFNHVTVDDVIVSSAHLYAGSADRTSTIALASRLAEHQYGGDDPSTPMNLQGLWSVTENVDATACGEGFYTTDRIYSVTQTNASITISSLGHSFSGTIDGNQITWSGAYSEYGETMSIRFSGNVSNDTLTGTALWDWTDGASSCSGTTTVTAVRQPTANASWKSEVVDSPASGVHMALDASNTVHLAYDGKYANNANGTWQIEAVQFKAQDSPMIFFWLQPRLAVDPQQNLHACFSRSPGIWYATRENGAWRAELVDENGRDPEMAVDTLQAVHLVYVDDALTNLRYATNQRGSWTTETIGTCHGGQAAIAVDANAHVHIAYMAAEPSFALMHISNQSGQWVAKVVSNDWFPTAMAVDAKGATHIAAIGNGVHHITNGSGSWVAETVSLSGTDCALAIDAQGNIHLVWSDSDAGYNGFLTYATNADGTWKNWILPQSSTSWVSAPTFSLDSHGNGYVAYTCDNEMIYLTNGDDD